MGKKRIKTIDLSLKEEKKEKQTITGSGKQHGRVADMGAVMLEEMEKRQEAEKKGLLLRQPADSKMADKKKKKVKQVARPQKIRSKRYQTIKKLIKPNQLYPLPEAVELLKKAANAQFTETVELHLIVNEPGKLTKTIKTEAKKPLVHLKIGKTKETKKKLQEKIEAILDSIGLPKIKKAVLTSTMSPAIKIDLTKK